MLYSVNPDFPSTAHQKLIIEFNIIAAIFIVLFCMNLLLTYICLLTELFCINGFLGNLIFVLTGVKLSSEQGNVNMYIIHKSCKYDV